MTLSFNPCLILVSCAVESIRTSNVRFINIACAVSIGIVLYTVYQQCNLMSARGKCNVIIVNSFE